LHELTTNAVKYGALKQESGRIDITWRVEASDEEPRVAFEWRESGLTMPSDAAVRRRGYGTELIEQALRYQLSAETRLEFLTDGVLCRVEVPIAATAEEESEKPTDAERLMEELSPPVAACAEAGDRQ
jgi:two-component sensor histidine kinase